MTDPSRIPPAYYCRRCRSLFPSGAPRCPGCGADRSSCEATWQTTIRDFNRHAHDSFKTRIGCIVFPFGFFGIVGGILLLENFLGAFSSGGLIPGIIAIFFPVAVYCLFVYWMVRLGEKGSKKYAVRNFIEGKEDDPRA